jgi:hypothetical protein
MVALTVPANVDPQLRRGRTMLRMKRDGFAAIAC